MKLKEIKDWWNKHFSWLSLLITIISTLLGIIASFIAIEQKYRSEIEEKDMTIKELEQNITMLSSLETYSQSKEFDSLHKYLKHLPEIKDSLSKVTNSLSKVTNILSNEYVSLRVLGFCESNYYLNEIYPLELYLNGIHRGTFKEGNGNIIVPVGKFSMRLKSYNKIDRFDNTKTVSISAHSDQVIFGCIESDFEILTEEEVRNMGALD